MGLRMFSRKGVPLTSLHGTPLLSVSVVEALDVNAESAVITIGTSSVVTMLLCQKCRSVYCLNLRWKSFKNVMESNIKQNGIKNVTFVDTLSRFAMPTSKDKTKQPDKICAIFSDTHSNQAETFKHCLVELNHLRHLHFIKKLVYHCTNPSSVYNVLLTLCKRSENYTDPFVVVKVIPVDVAPFGPQLQYVILLCRASELNGQIEIVPVAPEPVKRTTYVATPQPPPKQANQKPPVKPITYTVVKPQSHTQPRPSAQALPPPSTPAVRTPPSQPLTAPQADHRAPMLQSQPQNSVTNVIQNTIAQSLEKTVASSLKNQVQSSVINTIQNTIVSSLKSHIDQIVQSKVAEVLGSSAADSKTSMQKERQVLPTVTKSERVRSARQAADRNSRRDRPRKPESSTKSLKSTSASRPKSPGSRTTKIPSRLDNLAEVGSQRRPSTVGRDERRRRTSEDNRRRIDTKDRYRRPTRGYEETVHSSRDSRHPPKPRVLLPDPRSRFGSGASRELETRKLLAATTSVSVRDRVQDSHRKQNELNTAMQFLGGSSFDRNYGDSDPSLDCGFGSAASARNEISVPRLNITNISKRSFSPESEFDVDLNQPVKRVRFISDTGFDSSNQPGFRQQEPSMFGLGPLGFNAGLNITGTGLKPSIHFDAGNQIRCGSQENNAGLGLRATFDPAVDLVASAISRSNTMIDPVNQTRWNERDIRTGFDSDNRSFMLNTIPRSNTGINSEFERFPMETVSGPHTNFDTGRPVMWERRQTFASFDAPTNYNLNSDFDYDRQSQSIIEERRTLISGPNASYDFSQSRQENRGINSTNTLSESFYGKRY